MLRLLLRTFALLIALSSTATHSEEAYWEYTFRPGDTIWSIADRFTTSRSYWLTIQELNKISEGPDRRIRPGTIIRIPVSMLKQQPAHATIIAVYGDAALVRKDEASDVEKDMEIISGDRLRTGSDGSIKLRFADGSTLLVAPDSEISMDTLSAFGSTGMIDTRLRVHSGQIETDVEKQSDDSRYEIITPAAVAAVRGTSFRISADGAIMRGEVTEGVIDVIASAESRELEEGYGMVAERDKPLPEPVKLLSAPELRSGYEITQLPYEFSWPPIEGAQSYRLQIATDDEFNQIIIDRTLETNRYMITGLDNQTHRVRIRGIDMNQLGGLDTSSSLRVSAFPEPPRIGTASGENGLEFRREATTEHLWMVQISNDRNFSEMIAERTSTGESIVFDNIEEGSYFYRARQEDDRGVVSNFTAIAEVSHGDTNWFPLNIFIGVLLLTL